MKILYVFLILILYMLPMHGHPWKPRHYVIIDTDGGMDDFRAINMLLASPDIRVLGITVTPGAVSGKEAYDKVNSLLKSGYQDGLLLGLNQAPHINPADFPMAKEFNWAAPGYDIQCSSPADAMDVVKYIYQETTDSIYFLCLGSLNIIDKVYSQLPEFRSRTAAILWSCSDFTHKECFNEHLDKEAYKQTINRKLPLRIIDGNSIPDDLFGSEFQQSLSPMSNPYASQINRSLAVNHKMFYDEIIPLWLHFPQFFETVNRDKIPISAIKAHLAIKDLEQAFTQIITGETVNQNQVINFSWRKEDYFTDVQPIMDETVSKFGKAEWEAVVMADELHRHLGVFAIVGAKMGIRAKEYFGAGIDEIKVTSFAGTIPPFSCMNDGLQVSTGATIGHGLISIATDTLVRPQAEFTYMNRTIRISLKPEYGKKIATEVKDLNSIYGLNSNIYWELIRRLAIRYWANFDRHEIFRIETVDTSK